MMDFRYLYTAFNGRINRKPYWLASLILIAVMVVLNLVVILPLSSASPVLSALVSLVLMLVFLYPIVALGVKRLHDRGKSGQLMIVFLAPGLVSQMGSLLGLTHSAQEISGQVVMLPNMLGTILGLVSLAIGIWALIELGIRQGVQGDNVYGPNPLSQAAA